MPSLTQPIKRTWWKESSVYQVYPASFKDSNADGKGDIPGIVSQLDYLKELGVDIVWLSPILKSPQVDMGYDISDYKDIAPEYGTMADHDALIKGLHERGMKYVLDLVVNHTSDQHDWFKQSRSSKDNPYRDWYVWRPARYEDGKRMPPNNWAAAFSGSAWEWDEGTQEYYLHLFAVEQPDLNWENPKVVEAVHEIIRFWLDRGVDGFRMDVINFISKTPGLPDADITTKGFLQSGIAHHSCGPRLHEFLQGIGAILKEYDAFSVGEMPGVMDTRELIKGVAQDRGELGMAFHFEMGMHSKFGVVVPDTNVLHRVGLDSQTKSKWLPRDFTVSELRGVVNKWQTFMLANQGWNALYMENHDQGRSISRFASDRTEYRSASSKMIAAHLALQCGTPFIYQGQELAQINVPESWGIEEYKDIELVNHWKEVQGDYADDKDAQAMFRRQYRLIGRDNARTPMQWSASQHAGFMPFDPDSKSSAKPWMSVHPDYEDWNAENMLAVEKSPFHYWKRVLALRKEYKDIFVYGDFDMIDMDHPSVVAYVRTLFPDDTNSGHGNNKTRALVLANFTKYGREEEQDDGKIWYKIPDGHADFLVGDTNGIIPELKNYSSINETKVDEAGKPWIKLRPYEVIVAIL